MRKKVSICAVITARNEYQYLQFLLPALASQQIDVAIIDNESTDRSSELYATYSTAPVISVESLPYRGFASLTDRMASKRELYQKLRHSWLVHHDADEVLEHFSPGRSLRDAIEEADAAGYTALNFDEFVFLPEPDKDYFNKDYYYELLRYYFFEPYGNRLNRAWKNEAGVTNYDSGGHSLAGTNLRFPPFNHLLRHYIVLSADHARNKYLHRTYDRKDIEKGWQGNRLHFTEDNLKLPADSKYLSRLNHGNSRSLSKENPAKRHFWRWENQA